jgi:hypothetical protein
MATNLADSKSTMVEWDGKALFNDKSILKTDQTSLILDEEWAKFAFLVKAEDLDPKDFVNRGFSSAFFKFTDTSLGGGMAINPKPQFTRYADARVLGRLSSRIPNTVGNYIGNSGMGRYYSEAIDDNSQIIHMRFGVPEFNSLTTFFTGFYNSSAARLAKTGRSDDLFFTMGQAAGLVAGVILWPILAINLIGNVGRFFFNKPSSKFYYLKPTMLTYWSAVNTLVNRIGVGRGLVPTFLKDNADQKINSAYEIDEGTLSILHDMMPDIISSTGAYDIYAVANKAQRIANKLQKDNETAFTGNSYEDFYGFVQKEGQTKLTAPAGKTFIGSLMLWAKSEVSQPNNSDNAEPSMKAKTPEGNAPAQPISFFDYLNSEMDDGSAFANFRVDYTGPVSESFSNSVGESEMAGKINSIASQVRSATFSFAGGNIVGGALGTAVNGALDATKSFISGGLDMIGMSGLVGLAGSAFVDIPKNWQSSTASLPKATYTIQLVSPYGNTISQMTNIYIPMCMLLAGALPISTGKQSYTSPFILELYDKGRCQTRLGMIDSLSITRGTGNLGFNSSGHAMAVDITFSIVDMSSIMHMPVSKGFTSGDSDGIFDDETVFSDYMSVLSSLDLHTQFYKKPKLKLALARRIRNVEQVFSKPLWGMVLHDKTPVGLFDLFYKGSANMTK